MKVVHLIINPASGAKGTEEVLKEEVLPLLKSDKALEVHEHRTACEGDGARIAKEIISDVDSSSTIWMVLLGGDGTTHEVLNGIVQQEDGKCEIPCNVKIALVPTGTANALYASLYPDEQSEEKSYKLKSLQAMLSEQQGDEYPLALSSVSSDESKQATIAHLITSHALHASILADSEALRSTHPGIERFKIASAQNSTRWTIADVELQGRGESKTIQRYDPTSSTFKDIDLKEAQFSDPILYFVCVTTDRLESTFVPAPFSGPSFPSLQSEALQRPSDAVDILIIRPLRDHTLKQFTNRDDSFWLSEDSTSIRENFAKGAVQKVVGGMYDKGKHVSLRYDNDGPTICEYFRCGGYHWKPRHDRAKRTCVDGSVFEADQIQVRVLSQEEGAGKVTVFR